MKVLLFAGLAEALGRRELELEQDGPCDVQSLTGRLRAEWPALAEQVFRVAVNQRYVQADALVQADDEIALIPPVSGG